MVQKNKPVTDRLTTQIQFRCSPTEKDKIVRMCNRKNGMGEGDLLLSGVGIRNVKPKPKQKGK